MKCSNFECSKEILPGEGFFDFPDAPMCTPCGSAISDQAEKEGDLIGKIAQVLKPTL